MATTEHPRFSHLCEADLSSATDFPTFYKFNPAYSSQCLGEYPVAGSAELDCAVKVAKDAFRIWSKTPAPRRAEILWRAAELTKSQKVELSLMLAQETGKPIKEAEGEIQEVIDTYMFFAGEGRRMYGITGHSELPDKSIVTIRQPLGVCGFITAWNFPAAVPSWKIAPALIAGNVGILKPSELAPQSGLKLAQNLVAAGLPPGVISVLFGGADLGNAMVQHSELKLISFTGSTEVGRRVYEACGRSLKRCALELGGKNAIIALADADPALLLEGVLWGAFGTAGQRCTSTSRLILQRARWTEQFLADLTSRAVELRLGDPLDPATQVGPLISESHLSNVHASVVEALAEGARLLCGGSLHQDTQGCEGHFYLPTIIDGVTSQMKIAHREVFGPVLAVFVVQDYSEAIELANSTAYGLSTSIYTNNLQLAKQAELDIQSGMVYINAPTIGAECGGAAAFGGWKHTGNGTREGGVLALETYTQYKTIYIDYSNKLQRAQLD